MVEGRNCKMEDVNGDDNMNMIDESLYSRQLYVMGHEAQKKMGVSKVLLIGLNGLGVEIAKNVILAGVHSLTLVDETLTTHMDLSAQFYLTEEDIGKPRAESCVVKLAELNPYVRVGSFSGELNESFVASFTVREAIEKCIELWV